jgi:hypothetical protein
LRAEVVCFRQTDIQILHTDGSTSIDHIAGEQAAAPPESARVPPLEPSMLRQLTSSMLPFTDHREMLDTASGFALAAHPFW